MRLRDPALFALELVVVLVVGAIVVFTYPLARLHAAAARVVDPFA